MDESLEELLRRVGATQPDAGRDPDRAELSRQIRAILGAVAVDDNSHLDRSLRARLEAYADGLDGIIPG